MLMRWSGGRVRSSWVVPTSHRMLSPQIQDPQIVTRPYAHDDSEHGYGGRQFHRSDQMLFGRPSM